MIGKAAKVPVTAVLARTVRPGCIDAFEEWQRGITEEAARFEGYGGITIIRPSDPARPEYVIILQFDHPVHLHRWMESDARRSWLKRCDPLVESPGTVQEMTGLEHWFTLPNRPAPRPAPRHKMWILSWITAFGLASAITVAIGEWLGRLPKPLSLLVLTFLMTGTMTYVLMPRVTRACWRWLYPPDP